MDRKDYTSYLDVMSRLVVTKNEKGGDQKVDLIEKTGLSAFEKLLIYYHQFFYKSLKISESVIGTKPRNESCGVFYFYTQVKPVFLFS